MAGEQLRLRFERGQVVVELEGDAPSVQAVLAGFTTGGFGRFLDFFDGTGLTNRGSGPEDEPSEPEETEEEEPALEPLASPARVLTFAVDRLDVVDGLAGVDLGGGAPRNLWARLMGVLAQDFSFDPQGAVDQALSTMAPVLLFQVATADGNLAVEQRADVSVSVGQPVHPDRTQFRVDPAEPAVTLPGMLRGGRFVSQEPRRGSVVAEVALPLPVFPAAASFVLPVRAPRISFTLAPDGSYITQGRLGGAFRRLEVGPPIAAELTARLVADPQSPARMFDTGNCDNPDGTSAQPGDGVIDPCEVLSSDLFASLMPRDVHLFDDAGRYAPEPDGAPNAVSFGVAFTAAPASF